MIYFKHTGIYVDNILMMSEFYKNVFNLSAICENEIDYGELYDELYGFQGAMVKITKLISEVGMKNGYGDMLELLQLCNIKKDLIEEDRKCIYEKGMIHIAIGVDDIENIKEKVNMYGGKMMTDILIKGERKCFFCMDPEENFIEVIE